MLRSQMTSRDLQVIRLSGYACRMIAPAIRYDIECPPPAGAGGGLFTTPSFLLCIFYYEMKGRATVNMTTDDILALTRG
jgi:hypothetical protein